MKIIRNEALIKRNGRIGQWTSLGALGVLGVGMYLSFTQPNLFVYSIGALILGFTMTQVGMYFSNRWGRSPRPDEQLDAGLKGLPGDVTIYHYAAPAAHLLVGAMGIWALIPDSFPPFIIIEAVDNTESGITGTQSCGHGRNIVIKQTPIEFLQKAFSIGYPSFVHIITEGGSFCDTNRSIISIHNQDNFLPGYS